ncbi:MAG: heavy metal translocating P-type ATPase metal-binding domain-containing protein [Akkermansiaceae bacterium]
MHSDCIHCSTPLESSQEESGFCCTGCEFVHQLIHQQGLEKFYDLKRGETTSPLRDQPFQKQDFSWLEEAISDYESEHSESTSSEFQGSLQGISCIGCVWLVEKLFMRKDGALRCDIIPTTGNIYLTWQRGECDITEFASELQQFGYLLGRARAGSKHSGEFRQLGSRLGICGAFAMNAMAFSLPRYLDMPADFTFAGIFELITFLSATLAMLVGGSWFIKRAYYGIRARILHMDTPIALGVSLAYLGSLVGWLWKHEGLLYFDFVAIFIFLMLGGRWLQTAAVERNRNRLLEQTPVPTKLRLSESKDSIDTQDIDAGTIYLLPAGQTAPVTSTITRQSADFSLEWINGEPDPVHRAEGISVPAGAINLSDSSIEMRAEEAWEDSLLSKLISSSESVTRSPLMEKVLRYYLTIVFLLGISGGLTWLFIGDGLEAALQVTISVFVISCPCALGVALPLADELASGKMRSRGVFIRKAAFWSRLRQIRTLFFDKTGTLTMDLPELVDDEIIHNIDNAMKPMLAALCAKSRHPMSRAIMRTMGMDGQKWASETAVIPSQELPGLGTQATDEKGNVWSLGKCSWDGSSTNTIKASKPGCELRKNSKIIAYFEFKESLRPEAASTLDLLKCYKPRILSGDHHDRVQDIASTLGVAADDVYAGLSPEDKAELVSKIDPTSSLFMGDGANDSLAFDSAAMSGAVAGRGLLEAKSDFYFLSSGLAFIPAMFALARRHATAIRAVFTFSVIYNLLAISVCLAGKMNPLLAAILMPLSSIVSLAIVGVCLGANDGSKSSE